MGELAELMSDAAIEATAVLHHAWFTGMTLMVASREGPEVVGEWVRRTFRRQHEAKFLFLRLTAVRTDAGGELGICAAA